MLFIDNTHITKQKRLSKCGKLIFCCRVKRVCVCKQLINIKEESGSWKHLACSLGTSGGTASEAWMFCLVQNVAVK